MLRILLLALDVNLSRNRGDSIHLRNLAESLARLGNVVNVIAISGPNPPQLDRVNVTPAPSGSDPAIVGFVWRICRAFRPDVIYERRFSSKIGAAASLLNRRPFVVEINGLVEDEAAMQGRPLPANRIGELKASMRHLLLRRASAVVTVTDGLREAIAANYHVDRGRISVVPNGVDPRLFHPGNQAEARMRLSIPEGPVACFVGNLVRWQGLDFLLQAIQAGSPQTTLLLLGDGPERNRLKRAAGDLGIDSRVRFFGEVPYDIVPSYLAASDLCVAPFTAARNFASGGSPLKVYEYLACGRPIVVTAVPGVRELVAEFGCGIVVPQDDPSAFAAAIERILRDPSFSAAAVAASAVIRNRFSWDRTAERVTAILRLVTATHSRLNSTA